jgi:hypothetical protein
VEIALENMRVDLSTTTAENESLNTNVAELHTQLNDLLQQQLQVLIYNSRLKHHQCSSMSLNEVNSNSNRAELYT